MKYSVVNSLASPPRVVLTYPLRWMAALMAKVYGGERRGYDVAVTPTQPQEFINVCVHRDQLIDRNIELNKMLQDALDALMPLVARDEAGKWATIFEADHPVAEHAAASLDRITAAV